ncbi:MAG: dihydropteroate synthase [Planctomycetota bacterium]|nr:MAG: dihydropteroate synthase [Planctomycetota bacterium]
MVDPWEVPHYEREHHACPIGAGWWRGPAPRTGVCERALAETGIIGGAELADGSFRYRFLPGAESPPLRNAAGDPDEPHTRASWIACRLFAARRAFLSPFHEPTFMAVLNLTEDSFSDGGTLNSPQAVYEAALQRQAEGATLLDLGAESTRPGARGVAAQRQLQKLLPAMEVLAETGFEVSIDTRSAEVAETCLNRGAGMINDVSALEDFAMGPLVAERGCRLVLMHTRGKPADMQTRADYRLLLGEVMDELAQRVLRAFETGVQAEQLILDPGIGFAKTAEQSLELVGRLDAFRALGFPLLVGPSRKSFMEAVLDGKPPAARDGGTAGAAALCAAQGASYLRLHRGGDYWDAVKVAWAAAAAAHAAKVQQGADREPTSGSSHAPAHEDSTL